MRSDPTKRALEHLIDSLARERELLIAGRFDDFAREIEARGPQTERLKAAAAQAGAGASALMETAREAAAANVQLLEAAIRGVEAGKRRLAEIEEAGSQLSTYNAAGAPVAHRSAFANSRKA